MSARRVAAVALVLSLGLLAGCGRAASTTASLQEGRATAVPVTPDPNRPRVAQVDGKDYAENAKPAPFTTPTPAAAPEAGLGHLRLYSSILRLSPSCTGVLFRVLQHGEGVYAKYWDKAGLRAAALGTIAENLPPGEYDVVVEYYLGEGDVYDRKTATATVAADKTVDLTIK